MISKDIIKQLAAKELVDANTKHEPKFNSPHEAYAVIKEELEELQYEVKMCECFLSSMWSYVKRDDPNAKQYIDGLMGRAIKAVQEGIQVIAMCKKALDVKCVETTCLWNTDCECELKEEHPENCKSYVED